MQLAASPLGEKNDRRPVGPRPSGEGDL